MQFRELSPELQEIAETKLNEIPSRVPDDLRHLRKWINEQPHLNARTDDQWLLAFLRGCKFNLKKTKEKLDYFYSTKTASPDFFSGKDPFRPEIQELLDYGTCIPLPNPQGNTSPTILLIRANPNIDCNKITIMEIIKLVSMTLDILMNEDDNFSVSGIGSIIEVKGFPLKYIFQITPGQLKKVLTIFQYAYPIRPQQIHFLNVISVLEPILKLVKFFMTEKLKKRTYMYSESHANKILDVVSPEILPEEYGGTAGPLNEMIVKWKLKVESYREWFLEDANYRTDESLRPKQPNKFSELIDAYKRFFFNTDNSVNV